MHRLNGREIRLLRLDYVFAFVCLLASEVERSLKETKDAVLQGPVIIAMTMIASQDSGCLGGDLLRSFEPPISDALLQGFEFRPYARHSFAALFALKVQTLLGMDNKLAVSWLFIGNLLNQCLGRSRLLPGRDVDRAFNPGTGRSLNVVEHFTATPAIAADDVAMTIAA